MYVYVYLSISLSLYIYIDQQTHTRRSAIRQLALFSRELLVLLLNHRSHHSILMSFILFYLYGCIQPVALLLFIYHYHYYYHYYHHHYDYYHVFYPLLSLWLHSARLHSAFWLGCILLGSGFSLLGYILHNVRLNE